MPEIRLSDPSLIPELLAALADQPDVVAEIVPNDGIEISILGSYNKDALRMVAYLRIRAWEAAQRARGRDVRVELID